MADLELYIDPMGFVYIGGKPIYHGGGEPLHAWMAEPYAMKMYPNFTKLLAPEWIKLMRLWNVIREVTKGTVFNVLATKEARHKEGYVMAAIIVDAAGKPKERLRWGADRPPTQDEIVRDLVALHQLIQYDLRLPSVFEDFHLYGVGSRGNFYLGTVVNDRADVERLIDYMDDVLERNFPSVFKSLQVIA